MTIQDLILLATNRRTFLSQRRSMAEQVGDVQAVIVQDSEIAETEATIVKLQSMPS